MKIFLSRFLDWANPVVLLAASRHVTFPFRKDDFPVDGFDSVILKGHLFVCWGLTFLFLCLLFVCWGGILLFGGVCLVSVPLQQFGV